MVVIYNGYLILNNKTCQPQSSQGLGHNFSKLFKSHCFVSYISAFYYIAISVLSDVCSLVGLVVLLPINYDGVKEDKDKSYSTMDSFTISNVRRGSQRLWVHFACLCFISFYGMYLLYKEYEEISIQRIQQLQNLKHTPDRYTVIVREIPLCIEHKARDCSVHHFFSKYYPNTYYSYQMVYNTENLDELMVRSYNVHYYINDSELSDGYDA
ncbi:putative 10TM putative phosphate transporter, cytosolic domain-containing protein [Medicago truncatula]|uniref:Putative 10TM putative phosphate transporter, cytosolic domain-containing protein n=1 Tax=Medicago truncatula TaxID=3880 RepID=A0A396IJQ9_MEDTR|nr:putative 10TM putative phosphate transporter, cytosolic domain-containing protein [Medicago truncatula]